MNDKIKNFNQFKLAKELLSSVKNKHLSLEERIKLTKELASYILETSLHFQTSKESKQQESLAVMIKDPIGKPFTNALIDQVFRSKSPERVANQMIFLLDYFGIPEFLPLFKKLSLKLFRLFGEKVPNLLVPLFMIFLRKQTSRFIIPGEGNKLASHIKKRKEEGIRLNINHLGEAVLGEKEASHRLNIYLKDLTRNDIDYISVKISTIYSQINTISREKTLVALAEKLRKLYRQAIKNPQIKSDGTKAPKFINLDMEEYKDLHLTKDLFKLVLGEEEFLAYSGGIVLQAYLPDSYDIQKELTVWAKERIQKGGAPIKIRLVKGANLSMEQCEASLRNWPQTPYLSKIDTDANYKRMLHYALKKENAPCVNLGVGSHNIFDIAYAFILSFENNIEHYIGFEMLEGMADHIRRVVHELSGDMLLYCPVATKRDFQSAIAYLIRRLDENTGSENFLRHSFDLKPNSEHWESQSIFFKESCYEIKSVSTKPRRHQNRHKSSEKKSINKPFENESDTDFSLPYHSLWAKEIIEEFENKTYDDIPLVINGEAIHKNTPLGSGTDPSNPEKILYNYSKASDSDIHECVVCAKDFEKEWSSVSLSERCQIIQTAANLLREKRKQFIGVMIADGGKSIPEADLEFSEAIDFADYYIRSALQIDSIKSLEQKPKGTILVVSPWNFPISIPCGGIVSALITGNCVIFKPAPETVLCAYKLVELLWEAGIPKKALQFITCQDEPTGSNLIKNPQVNGVILTGSTETAEHFLNLRPDLSLFAETGGKNSLIITAMADKDLAIKDLVTSAFAHNGQKCSAASLAILEKEVYDDPNFLKQLKDATESLLVGSAWDPTNKITPLINPPNPRLLRGLTQLEPGEAWLLKPQQNPTNPNLWSPGIKLGVKKGGYTQQTELFGPVLGLMKAQNLNHAIDLANSTPYGLTSGIHTLDEREQLIWQHKIIAGNCYINRTITGAIVQRQPFGGCKKSSFGNGSKAGGPNYLLQLVNLRQSSLPQEKAAVNDWVNNLSSFLEKIELSVEELGTWYASIANYALWWHHFRRDYDPNKLIGQDNIQRYVTHKKVAVRIYSENKVIDYLRIFAAALTTQTPLEVSWNKEGKKFPPKANWQLLLPFFNIIEETEEEFIKRIENRVLKRVRMISTPSKLLYKVAASSGCFLDVAPVLANGRVELLHFLREVSLSLDYHRYGNLGLRENEIRKDGL